MSGQGKFKRQISLLDLSLIGLGAIFGSGWLFAVSVVAGFAGPAGWISWLIGGLIILSLGLVYAELGAALPRAGGIIRYPVYTHGPLTGFMISLITIIAFTSILGAEAEAVRQYADAWVHGLTVKGSTHPTTLGWFVQLALLFGFFLLNYWSVKIFAKVNTIMSIIKYFVPILIIVVLLAHLHPENFSAHGFAPFGFNGIQQAISLGGIMFSYLGIQPIVSAASEAKNPSRTVPLALVLSILAATAFYLLLQISFVGAIPGNMLSGGWSGIEGQFSTPFFEIVTMLGMGWVATFVLIDAVISPTGTLNVFMSTSSRIAYGWARNKTFFKVFAKIHEKTGAPRPATWLALCMGVFWTMPFPSWDKIVGLVSAALILSYAVAPISAAALRKRAPDMERPFKLKGMRVIAPLSFIFAAFVVYWSGWQTVSWLLGSQLLVFVVYLVFNKFVPTKDVSLAQQIKSTWWLVFFYAAMIVMSGLGTFGGLDVIPYPWDLILVAVASLISFYWSKSTSLSEAIIDEDPVEEDEPVSLGGDISVKQ